MLKTIIRDVWEEIHILNIFINQFNKCSGKKILNTTFYPDQKGINKSLLKENPNLKEINKLKRKI